VQFALQHKPLNVPSLMTMRAYTSFTPKEALHSAHSARLGQKHPIVRFVSLQGLHWEIHEIVEYCDKAASTTSAAIPVAFSPEKSTPFREYSLKYMEWNPIRMDRELLDNGATVENMVLISKDHKIKISCVIPVNHPQSIDGEEVNLTQQKCSFYIRQWDFTLKCPAGKTGSLAMSTKVTARDDHGTGDGKPTLTPRFKGQLAFDKNKVSMQFEKQAVIHIHKEKGKAGDFRSSVPVIMTQAKKLEWTTDSRFKTNRHVYFSFIVSDVSKFKSGILTWDPELSASFKAAPEAFESIGSAAATPLPESSKTRKDTTADFVQLQTLPTSEAMPKQMPTLLMMLLLACIIASVH